MKNKKINACNSSNSNYCLEETKPILEFFKLLFEIEKKCNTEVRDVNPKYRNSPYKTQ